MWPLNTQLEAYGVLTAVTPHMMSFLVPPTCLCCCSQFSSPAGAESQGGDFINSLSWREPPAASASLEQNPPSCPSLPSFHSPPPCPLCLHSKPLTHTHAPAHMLCCPALLHFCSGNFFMCCCTCPDPASPAVPGLTPEAASKACSGSPEPFPCKIVLFS